jgi:ELWxxDGT repeat protein
MRVEHLEDRCVPASGLSASLVADLVPGPGSSNPQNLANMNGTLYFATSNPTTGTELWKSDGTAAGTVLLAQGFNSSNPQVPQDFTWFNNAVYFEANYELWKSDGTPNGTVIVDKKVSPIYLTVVGSKLLFAGTTNAGTNGLESELWVTDGTAKGTVLVKDIYPGSSVIGVGHGNHQILAPNSSFPSWLTNFNGALYFTANDGIHGTALWRSDGTAAGTVLVYDVNPTGGTSNTWDLTDVNGTLFFAATWMPNNNSNVNGLWKSDGTASGTVMLANNLVVQYGNLTDVNGTVFFGGNDGTSTELWKSDGTTAGTVALANVVPSDLTAVGNTVFFNGGTISASSLWKSDGTAAGTVRVSNVLAPQSLTNVNGLLYFSGADGTHGNELWQSDGTTGGTVMVQDINPGSASSDPSSLTAMNNKLYFAADDGVHGQELWDPPPVETGATLGPLVAISVPDPLGLAAVGNGFGAVWAQPYGGSPDHILFGRVTPDSGGLQLESADRGGHPLRLGGGPGSESVSPPRPFVHLSRNHGAVRTEGAIQGHERPAARWVPWASDHAAARDFKASVPDLEAKNRR